jgi:N-carbamoylputrescine amidase
VALKRTLNLWSGKLMSRLLKIALIQQQATKNKQKNIKRAMVSLEQAAQQGAQLIAFAELAFTRFYPQRPSTGKNLILAETIPGPTTDIFSDLARTCNVVVVLNLYEKIGNKTYDSSPVINTNGEILGVTHMVHIMEGPGFFEQGYYFPGDGDKFVYETAVGKIGVAI